VSSSTQAAARWSNGLVERRRRIQPQAMHARGAAVMKRSQEFHLEQIIAALALRSGGFSAGSAGACAIKLKTQGDIRERSLGMFLDHRCACAQLQGSRPREASNGVTTRPVIASRPVNAGSLAVRKGTHPAETPAAMI
jgi:hypothetical protein